MIADNAFASTSTTAEEHDKTAASKKISAYYSLVFPHFTFYIQTLSVTIGRRCSPSQNASTSSSNPADNAPVDVDLGALKSVSRLHAKIEYDSEQDRFVLAVIGRNGAWVDGVWSGSGSRAPLGERSQIQIASRTFEFVLPPPPPPPDDTPSPSSHSSSGGRRKRSPSLDITSFSPPSSQPSRSPPLMDEFKPLPPPRLPSPPRLTKLPPPPTEPQLPNSNSISRSTKNKKRKKSDIAAPPPAAEPEEKPRPEQIPPKPTFTYSQLIYRAIKALNNKATLQEICAWIMNEFEYYRYTDSGSAWMSSIRHNLSSSRAFKKLERCGGDRGKGFFWSLDEEHQHIIEEQEAKSQQQAVSSGTKGKKKEKGTPLSEPPFKRSAKSESKGAPPPLLTSTPRPLPPKVPSASVASPPVPTPAPVPVPVITPPTAVPVAPMSASVLSYRHPAIASTSVTSTYSGTPISGPNPYAALTQSNWRVHSKVPVLPTQATSPPPPSQASPSTTTPALTTNVAPTSAFPDVPIPIVLGPIPPSHPDYSPSHPNNSSREGYMVLHERKLVLDPNVFSDLTPAIIADLEKMGARQALDVLTGHMVRVLKERRKARKSAKARGRGGKLAGGVKRKEPGDAPFTTAPLPVRSPAATTNNAAAPPPLPLNEDTIINIEDSDGEEPAAKKRKLASTGSQ